MISSNSKTMVRVLFILCTTCSLVISQKYSITRIPNTRIPNTRIPNVVRSLDIVQIPSQLCGNATKEQEECVLLGGKRIDDCQCECSNQKNINDQDVYTSSTFGFYNEQWRCHDNTVVRQNGGCLLSVDSYPHLYDPILTISGEKTVKYDLYNISKGDYIDQASCLVDKNNTFFLKCHGQLEPMNITLVKKRFSIKLDDESQVETLVISAGESSAYPLPSGGIIILGVKCGQGHDKVSSCIVLKIEGNIECPVNPSTSSSPSPTPTSSSGTFSKTFSTPSTSYQHTPLAPSTSMYPSMTTPSYSRSSSSPLTSTSLASSAYSSLTSSFPAIGPTLSQASSTVYATSSIQTTPTPTKANGKDSSNKGAKSALIGFIIAGVLVLVIIIIVIILLFSKRRTYKRRKQRKQSSQSTTTMVENDCYGIDSSFEFNDGDESPEPEYYNTKPGAHMKGRGKPFTGVNRSSISNEVYNIVENIPNKEPKSPLSTEPLYNNPQGTIFELVEAPEHQAHHPNNGPHSSVFGTFTADPNQNNEPLYNEPGIVIDDTLDTSHNDEPLYYDMAGSIICDTTKGAKQHGVLDEGNLYNDIKQSHSSGGPTVETFKGRDVPNVYQSLSYPNMDNSQDGAANLNDEPLYQRIT